MKYIGILLDNNIYRGIPSTKTGYEKLSFYEEAAKLYGLTPCFFRLQDIKPGMNKITAYVKKHSHKNYKKVSIPVPRVIHNRALHFSREHQEYLQSLAQEGIIIFNQWNRYRKLDVYNVLKRYRDVIANLPETRKATVDNIILMMNKYSKLIIKPNSGSLGKGLMKVERHDNKNMLIIFNKNENDWVKIPFAEEIPEVLQNRISSGKYIVQEFIQLATYKGNPFDLRVSCQKNHLGKWQMTGIAGKVAKNESFITNVARGGTARQLGELLQDTVFDEKKITKKIEHVALKISKILEEHFPGLADIGLDIGITADGVIKFIECNGRDLRYSFRNANMHNTWKKTYANPMGYASFLLDKF